MPRVGCFQAFHTARRTIQGFEAGFSRWIRLLPDWCEGRMRQVTLRNCPNSRLNRVYFEKRSFSSSGSRSGLFNALSERDGADSAVKDVFSLSEGKPV